NDLKATVRALLFTADGKRVLVAASVSNGLQVWDPADRKPAKTLAPLVPGLQLQSPTFLGWSKDGSLLNVDSEGKNFFVLDLKTNKDRRHTRPAEAAHFVAVSADGRRAATATFAQKVVTVWDLGARQPKWTLAGHAGNVSGLALTVDGRFAVSA